MNFKVLPVAGKISLVKHHEASDDPEKHKMWANLFRGKMTNWAIPTGQVNDLLVLDVDVKGDGYETLKKFPVPATMWQRTPSGGAHYLFRYPKDGNRYGNKVKFLPGLDSRGDGGYIVWYGADPQPILEAPAWFTGQVLEGQNQTQIEQQTSVKIAPEIAAGIIQRCLDVVKEAPQGERNNTLNIEAFKVGQLVASGAFTMEYALEALTKASLECGLKGYEVQATIRSGLAGGLKKPMVSPFGEAPPNPIFPIPPIGGPRWTPLKFTRDDLLNTKHLRKPQLFQDWSSEDITLTTADGGTGKTTMKLFEAVCLALGERFLGFKCITPGKTLYITGEDTDKKLIAMVGQILRQMGLLEDAAYDDKVKCVLDSIIIKKDSDLCLIGKDRQGFLYPSAASMERVMQAVDDHQPKMIVFDPISSFWGSENALNDMNKAVTKFMAELVERSQACVEMINHMGKQSSSAKDMTQFAGRGGTGLPSNARVVRTMRGISNEDYTELTGDTLLDKQSAMQCNVSKFSDGSPLYNKPFLIVRDGYLFARKLMTEAKAREAERELSDTERVFQFIKESRSRDKWPSAHVIGAYFMTCGNPLSEARTKRALHLLEYEGHMGEKLTLIENPDQGRGGKVFTVTDMNGNEV